jgi:hypothetical protein
MSWLKQAFSRRRQYAELSEEIREHIEEKTAELISEGMAPNEAAAAAHRQFGNVMLVEGDGREVWRWSHIEDFLADVRYGFRALRHNPVFAAIGCMARRWR